MYRGRRYDALVMLAVMRVVRKSYDLRRVVIEAILIRRPASINVYREEKDFSLFRQRPGKG